MGFFRDTLHEKLSQGDIVRVCHYGSLPPVRVVRRWRDQPAYPKDHSATVFPHPLTYTPRRPPAPPLFSVANDTEDIVFQALEGHGIVISNDCQAIDKSENQSQYLKLTERQKSIPWHVAPLRAWPGPLQMADISGEKVPLADLIHAGKVKKYWELPALFNRAGKAIVPRSFVDLRYLTPLQPATLRIEERVASLDDDGVSKLQQKLFTFFSGKALPKKSRCRHCGKTSDIELDELLDDDEEEV